MTTRRSFITGLIAFVAAPAIVKAGSLMPVKSTPSLDGLLKLRTDAAYAAMRDSMNKNLYGDLVEVTRKAFAPLLYVDTHWDGSYWTITTRKVQIG